MTPRARSTTSFATSIALAGALAGAATALAPPLRAQAVRVRGLTTFRYVDVHVLEIDSVPVSRTLGDGVLRRSVDGVPVQCVPGDDVCRYFRSGAAISSVPATQDLWLSGWGFGRGVRAYAHLRGRTVIGGDHGMWPQADRAFDALEAYVELDRERFRARAGRQWQTTGLGYYNYDGADLLLRATRWLSAEGYAGWSLARGLDAPVTSDALAAVESFAPDARGLLFGVQLRARPRGGPSLGVVYQREIRSDRLGLYSERFAFDGVWRLSRAMLSGAIDEDVASRVLNELRLRADVVASPALSLHGFVRRHEPYFDLWTIWGAFSPVGFEEAGAGAVWRRPGAPLGLQLDASRRRYPDTGAGLSFAPLRSAGWRIAAAATLDPLPAWSFEGRFASEIGFGTGLSDASVRARRALGGGAFVGLGAVAFQRASELRVDEGTVAGVDIDFGARLGGRAELGGSAAGYRQFGRGPSVGADWNQIRGSLWIGWTVGTEPGASAGAGR